jgi:hypothetical protein
MHARIDDLIDPAYHDSQFGNLKNISTVWSLSSTAWPGDAWFFDYYFKNIAGELKWGRLIELWDPVIYSLRFKI